jgi:hypothetical protein
VLEAANLCLSGLVLNADKYFEMSGLRQTCVKLGFKVTIPVNRWELFTSRGEDQSREAYSTIAGSAQIGYGETREGHH